MGSGGSRHLQIVQPQVNVTPFSSHPEYPTQSKMLQEQWLSHDREDESSEEISSQEDVEWGVLQKMLQEQRLSHDREDETSEESSSQQNVEWDVSHTGTLRKYQMNYPEQAEDFQKMFDNIKVLKNTMNNSSTRSDRYSKDVTKAIRNLLAIHRDIVTSTGTVASEKMRVVDLMVEIEAADCCKGSLKIISKISTR